MTQYIRYPASGGGGSGTVNGIGAIDSQPKSANGGVISGSDLIFQTADVTYPGLVSTGTQSFAGNKTFTGTISASNLSGTNTGDVTLNAVGAVPNGNGASLSGQSLTLQPANATFPGVLLAADWVRFDAAATATTSGTPNTFAGFDGSGDLYTLPNWNLNTITGGVYVPLNLTPADITGSHVIHNFVNNITPSVDLLNTQFQGIQNYSYLVGLNDFLSFIGFNNGVVGNNGGAKGSVTGISNYVDMGNSGDVSTSSGVIGINSFVQIRDDHTALNYISSGAFSVSVEAGGVLDNGGALINGNFNLDGDSNNGVQLLNYSSTINGTFTASGFNSLLFNNTINGTLQNVNGIINNSSYGATSVSNGQLGFQDNVQIASGADPGFIQSFQSNIVAASGSIADGIVSYSNTSQFNNSGASFGFTGYQNTPSLSSDRQFGIGFQDNINFLSGANITGDYTSLNLGAQFQVGSTIRSHTGINISPNFLAPITDDVRGIGVFFNNPTSGTGISGLDININNGTCSSGNITGLSINVTGTGNDPQGVVGLSSNARVQINSDTELVSALGFQIGNRMAHTYVVPSGSPVTGTDSIGNNLAGNLIAQDDVGLGGFGLGWASVGFIASVGVAATKTVDKITAFLPALSLPDPGFTTGGDITELNMIFVPPPLPQGGTATITDLYGFKIDTSFGDFGTAATNAWGLYIDSTAENYVNKLAINTPTQTGTETLEVNGTRALLGSTSGKFIEQASATTTSYTVTWPAAQGAASSLLSNDGSGNLSWAASSFVPVAPTIQKFLTGSGTYTRPSSPTPLYIKVKMVGGGGGGSGSGDAGTPGGNGGNGGNSTFGTALLVANGGVGGTYAGQGGVGGTASLGAAVGLAFTGGSGTGHSQQFTITTSQVSGGNGASSPFGGMGGGGSQGAVGQDATANTGSGGGGGGLLNSPGNNSGSGGGSGGYVDAIITSPAATYSYAIGAAGAAGAAGNGWAGGAGAEGVILVEEYYQ